MITGHYNEGLKNIHLIREKDMQRKNTVKKTRLVIKVAAGKMPFVMLSTSGIN
jgi:hypothetical protein